MRDKIRKIFIIFFCVCLVLGTIIYFAIPNNGFAKAEGTQTKIWEIHTPNALNKSELDENHKFVSFNVPDLNNPLIISTSSSQWRIIICRKDVDDGRIDIYKYNPKIYTFGVIVSDEIKAPKVTYGGSTINIDFPKQGFSYTEFVKDFTGIQFYKNPVDNNGITINDISEGELYIVIPKSLKVLDEGKFKFGK